MTPDSPWASPDTIAEVPVDAQSDAGPARSPQPRLIKAALLAVAVLAAVGTAMAVANRGGVDSPPAPSPSVPPTQPVASGYLAPGDLCQEADFTRLRPTFNTIGDLYPHGSKAPTLQVAACDGTTGNSDVTGLFSFEVQVSTRPHELAAVFDAQHDSLAARGPVTDIPGLGARAYVYVADGQAGLTVEVYDENLAMRLSWETMHPGDRVPAGLRDALVETCRSTLRLLWRG